MPSIAEGMPAAAVALGAVGLWVAEQLSAAGPSTTDVLQALPLTLLAAGGSVLLAGSRPVAALAAFVVGYAGQVAVTGWVDSVVALALWCGLLGLAARRSDLRSALVALALGGAPVVVFVLGREDPDAGAVGPSTLALWLIPWLAGRMLRARHERHEHDLVLVRSESDRRDAEERAAAAEDRAAIVRDVHDLLGHTLTSVVVQARTARASLDSDPEASRAALDAVEEAGRAAVAELRSLVAELGARHREPSERPDLTDLAALVDRVPIDVHSEVDADAHRLRPPVQATAYRVVQEALTNAIRHTQATRADVRIAVEGSKGVLSVEVTDPGPSARQPLPGAGTGLAGLRARVEELGGSLDAGRTGTGFGVRAVLPLEDPA